MQFGILWEDGCGEKTETIMTKKQTKKPYIFKSQEETMAEVSSIRKNLASKTKKLKF